MARAQRRANRKLARAAHRARQQKIGNIRASNQQQETNRREQHDQEWLDVADDVFLHGNERDAHVLIGLRVRRGEILRDAVHIGFRLRQRYARLQAANRVRAHIDTAVAKGRIIPLADGRVDVSVVPIKSEACRNHAHDRVGRRHSG